MDSVLSLDEQKKAILLEVEARREALRQTEKKLADIEQQKLLTDLESFKSLAVCAHGTLCRYNHTDGCSWGYEGEDWSGSAHRDWLEKVQKWCDGLRKTPPEVLSVLQQYAKLKCKHPDIIGSMDTLGRL